MVLIRSASTADATQIAAVMRDSWFAAYDGIIAPAIIDRATSPDGGARIRQSFRLRPWQRMIAAVARGPAPVVGIRNATEIVGYASYGPERDVLSMPWPYPRTQAGRDGQVAELYALYVHPATRTLSRTWSMSARRFYQRAGFAPDGARHVLEDLDGVTEIRYQRAVRG